MWCGQNSYIGWNISVYVFYLKTKRQKLGCVILSIYSCQQSLLRKVWKTKPSNLFKNMQSQIDQSTWNKSRLWKVRNLSLRFVTDNLRSHVGSAPVLFMMLVLVHLFSFLFCVFCIVFRHSVSCSEGCLCLWTVHLWLPIRFSLAFLYKYIHVVLFFYKNNLLIKNILH